MSSVSKMIKGSPSLTKKLFYSIVPFRYRYNKKYRETLESLNNSMNWPLEKLRDLQLSKVQFLCKYAYENTVYYKKVFNSIGMKPEDINSLNDFKRLPLLTKDIVRKNYKSLISEKANRNIVKFSTSGSTGSPFHFEGEDEMFKREAAYITRVYASHQSSLYSEKSVWLRRYQPAYNEPLFKYDYELGKRLYLSPFHLSFKNIKKYVKLINDFGGKLLNGYPSSIYILAKLLDESGLKLNNIQRIHCASENMSKEWRDYIEKVIGVIPKNHYGMVEKVSLFHQCSESNFYHENLEYGFTEFHQINDVENVVVGTSFMNLRMPFIRYVMNDSASLNETEILCKCGISLPLTVKDFIGRTDDFLYNINGELIPGPNFYTMMYKIPGLDMFRIIQEKDKSIMVVICINNQYSIESEKMIRKGLLERLGNIKVSIDIISEIKRNINTGKIRCIQNKGF